MSCKNCDCSDPAEKSAEPLQEYQTIKGYQNAEHGDFHETYRTIDIYRAEVILPPEIDKSEGAYAFNSWQKKVYFFAYIPWEEVKRIGSLKNNPTRSWNRFALHDAIQAYWDKRDS